MPESMRPWSASPSGLSPPSIYKQNEKEMKQGLVIFFACRVRKGLLTLAVL